MSQTYSIPLHLYIATQTLTRRHMYKCLQSQLSFSHVFSLYLALSHPAGRLMVVTIK